MNSWPLLGSGWGLKTCAENCEAVNFSETLPFVWPLSFVLVSLFVLRQLGENVKPVFVSVIGGLSKNAGSNATQYAIAIGFGLSASLSAFYDVFNDMTVVSFHAMSWHAYAALWTKVANPFIVAVLAYATQSNFVKKPNGTTPPFPPP